MQLQKKSERPMEGNCQVNDIVHKYNVTRSLPKKVYLGLHAVGEWKSRFYNHNLSFKHKKYNFKLHVSLEKCFKWNT